MSYVRILLATLLLAVLAACGGPTTPPAPHKPTISAVTPATAPRGGAIVVNGSGFGTSGKLTVGGVEASVSSWTDARIEATVASGTPDGWQDVVVSTAGGTDDFSPFFVGVEYSGTASGLQALLAGLDKGTAVLLQAQTYDLSATTEELLVDNHGLYGRGETQTTIKLSLTDGAIVLSDWGASVTIADLAIEGDSLMFLHGTWVDTLSTLGAARFDDARVQRTISLPSASGAVDAWRNPVFSDLGLLADALPTVDALPVASAGPRVLTLDAFAHAPEVALAPAALAAPKLLLQNVSYSEVAGSGLIGVMPFSLLSSLDLTLTDVTIDASSSLLSLFFNGNLKLERVDATAEDVVLLSYSGTLTVLDSNLQSATDVGLMAESGLNVSGSTVRAADGDIQALGAAVAMMGGGIGPSGGAIEITASTMEALDANLADLIDNGGLAIVTQYAPIRLADNVLIRSHGEMSIQTLASEIGEGDITLAGNGDVRAGVFKSEDAVNFRSASLAIFTGGGSLADTVTLDGNTMAATATLVVDLSGSGTPAFLTASQNALTSGDGANNGLLQLIAGTTGQLRLEDNVLSSDGTILVVAPDLSGTTAVLGGNTISAVGAGSPVAITQLNGGSCEVSGNTFEAKEVNAVNAALLILTCAGADPLVDTFTVTGNTMTVDGNGGSVIATQFTSGALAMTSNQIASKAGFRVTVIDVDGVFSANNIQQGDGYWFVSGDAPSNVTLDANVVTYKDVATYGLGLLVSGVGNSTVTGNEFTVSGTPVPTSVALTFATNGAPITIAASGNTFTNFSRALLANDLSVTAWGITATIENNIFDFPIDAAPKVAELVNVKDAIDARNNQWGANTSAATVATYVTLSGDTVAQGGSILLAPITLP